MLRTVIFAVGLALGGGIAQAQIAAEHPRNCVMNVGPTEMMFSAIQGSQSDEIFCQNISRPGPTDIILDARQPELRGMNIELRVLRDAGQKDWRDDLDKHTLTLVPASKHLADRGTASFHVNLDRNGGYIAIARATSDDGVREYVGEFRFVVGGIGIWWAVFAMLFALVLVLGYSLWRRRTPRDAPAASITG